VIDRFGVPIFVFASRGLVVEIQEANEVRKSIGPVVTRSYRTLTLGKGKKKLGGGSFLCAVLEFLSAGTKRDLLLLTRPVLRRRTLWELGTTRFDT
jgi:hypothetical protein